MILLSLSSRFVSPAALAAILGLAALPTASGVAFPEAYTLAEDGYMPDVSNQGNLGTCWAFATTTTLQSALLRQGVVTGKDDPNYQLSVWHLATANGNTMELSPTRSSNGTRQYGGWGGLFEFSIGYWTRGSGEWAMTPEYATIPAGGGPVLVSGHPNNAYPLAAAKDLVDLTPYVSPAAQSLAPIGISQTISYYWDRETDSLGDFQGELKDALLNYGALSVMVYVDDAFQKIGRTGDVYLGTNLKAGANHAVTLVGWDDNKTFTIDGVDHTGAWLIQNSWDSNWGAEEPVTGGKGYAWIAFDDVTNANIKNAMALLPRTNVYDATYTYSPNRVQNQIFAPYWDDLAVYVTGFDVGENTFALQRMVTPYGPSRTTIGALGLWQPDPGMTVSISIYDDWNPETGFGDTPVSSFSVTMNSDGDGGYQEVLLPTPLEFIAGEDFYVLLDFGDGYEMPIAVDVRTPMQFPEGLDFSGISWMSNDLSEWTDLATGLEMAGIFFLKGVPIFIALPDNGRVSGLMQTYAGAEVPELIFEAGSELYINGSVSVTDGLIIAAPGTSELRASPVGSVTSVGQLIFTGGGRLNISAPLYSKGDTHVISGHLDINGFFHSAGNIRVVDTFFILGPRDDLPGAGQVVAPSISIEAFGIALVEKGGSLTLLGPTDTISDGYIGTLANRGFINGSGVINGSLLNGGTISPGFSPGEIVISGDYDQTVSGAYIWESAGEDAYDRLVVGGTASLNGTLAISGTDGYILRFGDKYEGIVEANRIDGSFSKIVTPDGIRVRLLEKSDSLGLLIAPESYTQLATTPNERRVARALDQFIPEEDGDRFKVSFALDELRAEEYGQAFQAIMPSFYQGVASMGVNLAINQTQHLSNRLDALRFGAPSGYTTQGVQPVLVADGKETASGKESILIATPENRWGVWTQATGIFGKSYSVTDVPNYHYNSGGFLVGADYRWSGSFTTGLFAGYQGAEARYGDAGKARSDSANFGLYAAWGGESGFHASGLVMGGQSRFDVSRRIQFGSIDRTADSRFDAWTGTAMLETGYAFQLGAFRLGPIVSAQYTKLSADDFTERNARSLNLKVADLDNESFQTNLGARIAAPVALSPEVTLVPELRVLWNHEYLQDNASYLANLDGGRGRSFRYDQTAPSRDSVTLGTGASARLGEAWNATLFYHVNCASSQSVTHSVSASVGYAF